MRTKLVIIALVATMVASCQTMPNASSNSASSGLPYKALGTEPFWSLEINNADMVFQHDKVVSASNVEVRPSFNGWRYTSPKITADITFAPCSDGMSDRTYKDTVTVMVGKETYKGCGGGIIAPETFDNTSWRIKSINGTAIPPEREAIVSFADGRMSGTVGCNRLGASYTYAKKSLSFGSVISTRMGCQEPLASQELAFVSVLSASPSTSFTDAGALVLTGKDGAVVILEQSI